MDVNFSPGPIIAYRPPDDGGHFITDWKYWLETAGNFALLGAGGMFLSKGRLIAQSFELSPGVSKLAAFFIPFSVSAAEPGVIHIIADLAFYKFEPAAKAIDDLSRRYAEWLARVNAAELRQMLGDEGYNLVTAGGTITNLRAVVQIPPAWLTDP